MNESLEQELLEAEEKIEEFVSSTIDYIGKIQSHLSKPLMKKAKFRAQFRNFEAALTGEIKKMNDLIDSVAKEKYIDNLATVFINIEEILKDAISYRTKFMLNVIGPITIGEVPTSFPTVAFIEEQVAEVKTFIETAIDKGIQNEDAELLAEVMWVFLENYRKDAIKMHNVIRNISTEEYSYENLKEGFTYMKLIGEDIDQMLSVFFRRAVWIPMTDLKKLREIEQRLTFFKIEGRTMSSIHEKYKARRSELYDMIDNSFISKSENFNYIQFLTILEVMGTMIQELHAYGTGQSGIGSYELKFLGSLKPDYSIISTFIADECENIWKVIREKMANLRTAYGIDATNRVELNRHPNLDICNLTPNEKICDYNTNNPFINLLLPFGAEKDITLEKLLDLKEAKFVMVGMLTEMNKQLMNSEKQNTVFLDNKNDVPTLLNKTVGVDTFKSILGNVLLVDDASVTPESEILKIVQKTALNYLPNGSEFRPQMDKTEDFTAIFSGESWTPAPKEPISLRETVLPQNSKDTATGPPKFVPLDEFLSNNSP